MIRVKRKTPRKRRERGQPKKKTYGPHPRAEREKGLEIKTAPETIRSFRGDVCYFDLAERIRPIVEANREVVERNAERRARNWGTR